MIPPEGAPQVKDVDAFIDVFRVNPIKFKVLY